MRRTVYIFSALIVSAGLVLAGCSGSNSANASASASASASGAAATDVDCSTLTIDDDSDALPTLSGDAGSEPTVTWTGKEAPSNLTVKTLSAGDGATTAESDFVTVNYAGWQWDSSSVFDSSYQNGAAVTFGLSQVISGWRCGLSGHHVGDRLEMSIPGSLAYGDDFSDSVPTGTLVFVVEIKDRTTITDLEGATTDATMEGEQAVADRGITVTGDLGKAATVSVNDGATEPSDIEVIVLARGTGPAVTASSTILANMVYSSWDNSLTNSTWKLAQPQTISMSSMTALSDLVGIPAGSRVVVLFPATQDSSGNAIAAQAYVIDIDKIV